MVALIPVINVINCQGSKEPHEPIRRCAWINGESVSKSQTRKLLLNNDLFS